MVAAKDQRKRRLNGRQHEPRIARKPEEAADAVPAEQPSSSTSRLSQEKVQGITAAAPAEDEAAIQPMNSYAAPMTYAAPAAAPEPVPQPMIYAEQAAPSEEVEETEKRLTSSIGALQADKEKLEKLLERAKQEAADKDEHLAAMQTLKAEKDTMQQELATARKQAEEADEKEKRSSKLLEQLQAANKDLEDQLRKTQEEANKDVENLQKEWTSVLPIPPPPGFEPLLPATLAAAAEAEDDGHMWAAKEFYKRACSHLRGQLYAFSMLQASSGREAQPSAEATRRW